MTDRKKSIRRIGANIIETATGVIERGIVIIEDDTIPKSYPFTEEESTTEWTTGTIIIRLDNDGKPRAYKDKQLLK